LKAGADLNRQLTNGATPLFMASQNGYDECVDALLRAGADLERFFEEKLTALHVASQAGHNNIVAALIRAGADKNRGSKDDGRTPLFIACRESKAEAVEALLRAKVDVNKCSDGGYLPLHLACQNGHRGIVQQLLRAKADVNKAADKNGGTPLILACEYGHVDIVDILLQAGANKDHSCSDGNTPTSVALGHGKVAVVEFLRRAGADEDKSLLVKHFLRNGIKLSPRTLQSAIANDFEAYPKPRPSLKKLQHSAIHFAILLLNKDRKSALPVAQAMLATFPADHPTLPLLRSHVDRSVAPPAKALDDEDRAKLIAELIGEENDEKQRSPAKGKSKGKNKKM
jgi:ankyrin repeat protein